MPQELHVVRCYSCEAFQVDIVKKVSKWICKMCGEKQSLKKVYARGTGKECREFVKDLNKQRLSLPAINNNSSPLTDSEIDFQDHDDVACDSSERKRSKWSEYMIRDATDYANTSDDCVVKRPKVNNAISNNTPSKWDTFSNKNESNLQTEELEHYDLNEENVKHTNEEYDFEDSFEHKLTSQDSYRNSSYGEPQSAFEKPRDLQYFKDSTTVFNIYENKFGSANDLDVELDF